MSFRLHKSSIESRVLDELEMHGYTVVQGNGTRSSCTLVAVKGGELLFLHARRLKRKIVKKESVAKAFVHEIGNLAKKQYKDSSRQLWLFTEREGWRRFVVHIDGTIEEVQEWTIT